MTRTKIEDDKLPINALVDYVSRDWKLGELHGLRHWKNVHKNGMALIQPGVNPFVVSAFAYLHDSCRVSNGYDLEHGKRAAGKVDDIRNSILKNFTDDEIQTLKTACELHTITLRTGDPTIDTCFDADRLDLDRVGIIPDPYQMATNIGAINAADFETFKKCRDKISV